MRLEELKREDVLLEIDIVEHFWTQMKEVAKVLNIDDMEILTQFMNDEGTKSMLRTLLNGQYSNIQAQINQ